MSLATCLLFTALVPLALADWTEAGNETQPDLHWAIRQQEELDAAGEPVVTLSRRRRFLIYPEGSSLQLVFCLTYPTQVLIGDIFLMGATTALAWQLPQDPYSPFDHHADPLHRSDNVKNIYYTNEAGNVYSVKPLKKKKFLINPAMAKRSIGDDDQNTSSNPQSMKLDKEKMHKLQQRRDYLKREFMDEKAVHFHRLSRKDLYPKIEVFLNTLGHDGRSCVLKTLCQMGKNYHAEQGTFLDEIMRAIFTLPKGQAFASETHASYDRAHTGHEKISCEDMYPKCPTSVTDIPMR